MIPVSQVRLADGRSLAFAEFGAAEGRPTFYFHGFPGSRLEGRVADGAAARGGVRIVAVDRPGYGGSDFLPSRRLLDWPADVCQLADALGFARFTVVGVSGGAPYALVCAFALADRVDGAAVVCGLGPLDDARALDGMPPRNRIGLLAARRAPWLARPTFALLAPVFRWRAEWIVAHVAAHAGEPDRTCLARPDLRAAFAASFREAFRQGSRGAARDAVLYAQPWGFRLEDVRLPVRLWHGERDRVVPPAMGRRVARRLADCRATFLPDDGHFSLALTRAEQLFPAWSP